MKKTVISSALIVSALFSGSAVAQGLVYGAMLPASRSVVVNTTATVAASIVNPHPTTATNCTVSLRGSKPIVVNTVPASANIAPNGSANFTVSLTPWQANGVEDLYFDYKCSNRDLAPTYLRTNTLTFGSHLTPTADVISMAATAQNNGVVSVPGLRGATAFAVATTNIGIGDTISVLLNTGLNDLPVTLMSCVTSATGQCVTPITSLTTFWSGANSQITLAVFVYGEGVAIPFNPAEHRINVLMKNSGGFTVGATSVAAQIVN